MTVDEDRLHAEVDRRLEEQRATCEGLATRAGILLSLAVGLAAFLGLEHTEREAHFAVDLANLTVALVLGLVTLVPGLRGGVLPTVLARWNSAPTPTTTSLLLEAKIVCLMANARRLTVMRVVFLCQVLATSIATMVVVIYAAKG